MTTDRSSSPTLPSRRVLLLASVAGLGLAGCGFQLRRPTTLNFDRIVLVGFTPRSPFTEELRRAIEAGGRARVVETLAQAEVALEVLQDRRERSVVASTAAGQVREFSLRTRFRFRVRTPGGRVLIPDNEIYLSRDMSYNETDALAKQEEEELLYRGMQSDIVDQVMRQLAAVSLT